MLLNIYRKVGDVEKVKLGRVANERKLKSYPEFESKFVLGGKKYVLLSGPPGIRYKLNKLNLFPFLPKMEICIIDNQYIAVLEYDRFTKFVQIFWLSMFVLGFIGGLLGIILQCLNPNATFKPGIGAFVAPTIIGGILWYFLTVRRQMWIRSLDSAKEIISFTQSRPEPQLPTIFR